MFLPVEEDADAVSCLSGTVADVIRAKGDAAAILGGYAQGQTRQERGEAVQDAGLSRPVDTDKDIQAGMEDERGRIQPAEVRHVKAENPHAHLP